MNYRQYEILSTFPDFPMCPNGCAADQTLTYNDIFRPDQPLFAYWDPNYCELKEGKPQRARKQRGPKTKRIVKVPPTRTFCEWLADTLTGKPEPKEEEEVITEDRNHQSHARKMKLVKMQGSPWCNKSNAHVKDCIMIPLFERGRTSHCAYEPMKPLHPDLYAKEKSEESEESESEEVIYTLTDGNKYDKKIEQLYEEDKIKRREINKLKAEYEKKTSPKEKKKSPKEKKKKKSEKKSAKQLEKEKKQEVEELEARLEWQRKADKEKYERLLNPEKHKHTRPKYAKEEKRGKGKNKRDSVRRDTVELVSGNEANENDDDGGGDHKNKKSENKKQNGDKKSENKKAKQTILDRSAYSNHSLDFINRISAG